MRPRRCLWPDRPLRRTRAATTIRLAQCAAQTRMQNVPAARISAFIHDEICQIDDTQMTDRQGAPGTRVPADQARVRRLQV